MSLRAIEIVFLKVMQFTSDLTFYCVIALSPEEMENIFTDVYVLSDIRFGKLTGKNNSILLSKFSSYMVICL